MPRCFLRKAFQRCCCASKDADDDNNSVRATITCTPRPTQQNPRLSRCVDLISVFVLATTVVPPPGSAPKRNVLQKRQHKRLCRGMRADIPSTDYASPPSPSAPSSFFLTVPDARQNRHTPPHTPRLPHSSEATALRLRPGQKYQRVQTRHGPELLPTRVRVPAYTPDRGRFLGFHEVDVAYPTSIATADALVAHITPENIGAGRFGGSDTPKITISSSNESSSEWSREANRSLNNLHANWTSRGDYYYLQQEEQEKEERMISGALGLGKQLIQNVDAFDSHNYDVRPPSRMGFRHSDSAGSNRGEDDNSSGRSSTLVNQRTWDEESTDSEGSSDEEAVEQQATACSIRNITPRQVKEFRLQKRKPMEIMAVITENVRF
ncbi:hypothetical protein Micbo1qcDRAFT_201176 [Microdochium bolleyi]|uniref:Uncharacterized protein n=1 Tax=Microdochium bolleyi TaxID=196109 RepID=A0A136JGJ3_9PEZI|nr:hypothetical protein Micbo1qcDRAFT_201176 [Microdochium bolleyi]